MSKQQNVGGTWMLRRRWYVPVSALVLAMGLPGLGHVTGREPNVTWVRQLLPDPPAPLDERTRPGAGINVEVTALEECWVELEADGAPAFSKLLRAQQTQTVQGKERVLLITGNAAGVSVVFNGKSIGTLGAHGQRRIVDFSAEGFQFLARR